MIQQYYLTNEKSIHVLFLWDRFFKVNNALHIFCFIDSSGMMSHTQIKQLEYLEILGNQCADM